MDYNRVIADLNGLTENEFFNALGDKFTVTLVGENAYSPKERHEFGM